MIVTERMIQAKKYKAMRVAAGITGAELGRRLKVIPEVIYAIEAGERVLTQEYHDLYTSLKPLPPKPAWVCKSLQERLIELREDKLLTIEEAAKILKVPACNILVWESGFVVPDMRTLIRFKKLDGNYQELRDSRRFDSIPNKDIIISTINSGDGTTESICKVLNVESKVIHANLKHMTKVGCLHRVRRGASWIYTTR